jgi:hypothetical protein
MKNADLKLELIQKIIESDDLDILMNISELLHPENDVFKVNEPTEVYEKTEKIRIFNEWEQAKIDKAMFQYENGACISDEEAQKEIQAWLED